MAIRDLLWACPECRQVGGIHKERGGEVCEACGTRFRRRDGAMIEARRSGGEAVTLHARAWLERLPPITDVVTNSTDGETVRRDRVVARFATSATAIRHEDQHLNFIERFGEPIPATLTLHLDRLDLRAHNGNTEQWTMGEITAVQSSSRTLQVNARRRPLVSFRFPEASAHYWEELLRHLLREHYRRLGKGEIVEFQPRIVTG